MNKSAVILCAGKGSRLSPITNEIPKVLVEVRGKSLLDYKFESLEGLVDEVVLVVGYKKELIENRYGDTFCDLPIKYVHQRELLGSGHALMQARKHLNGKFLVLNGDDIYSRQDIESLLRFEYGILAQEVDKPQNFGVLKVDDKGNLQKIIEKPVNPPSNLVNIGCYLLDTQIFDFELKKSSRGEFELVDYLDYLISVGKNIKVQSTKDKWYPVNNFEELEIVNENLDN